MDCDEARELARELYRYDGGVTDTFAPDGRCMRVVSIRLHPGHQGTGVAADPVVATAYAWRNLKRKVTRANGWR